MGIRRAWRLMWRVGVLGLLAPGTAAAAGPWTTFLRAFTFNDLAVRGDTVWCATLEAGLLRFAVGPRRFDAFVREPGGLATNSLAAIDFDRSGRMWIGTYGRGASRLDPDGSWGALNAFDGLPSDTVNVVEAQGDTVWLGTTRGLALWDGTEIAGVLPGPSGPSPFQSSRITGIAVLGDTLWVATERGAYRSLLSTRLASWTGVQTGLPASQRIDGLACDGVSLVVLSNFATYRRDPALDRWALSGGIGAVRHLADDAGQITAAAGLGVFRWNGAGWTLVDGTLVSPGIPRQNYAVGVGPGGAIYAANLNGLKVLADGSLHFPPGPPGNNVLNLETEGARLYVNTTNEGIGRWDGTQWKYWFPGTISRTDTTFRDPRFVFALLVDRDGRKWFGQWAPLRTLSPCNPDTGMIEVLNDAVDPPQVQHITVSDGLHPARHSFARSSSLDSSGGRWFGMGSPCSEDPAFTPIGLDYYDSTGAFVRNFRPDNQAGMSGTEVRALTVDEGGQIWVGYKGQGIDRFAGPTGGAFNPIFNPVADSGTFDVRGLAAYGDSIWVYTTSELRRYARTGSGNAVATHTVPAGPAESAVRPLDVAPDGTVWLGSVNGVRCYRRDGPPQDFTTANSPLADDEVRVIRVDRRTGIVWIGSARGVNGFDPGFVAAPPIVPRLEVRIAPNPSRLTALGTRLRIAGNVARYEGAIVDLSGRVLRRFSAANDQVFWDGRDGSGEQVGPGVYFVRIEAGGRTGVARFVLLR